MNGASPWPVLPLSQLAEVRLGRQRSPKNHSGSQMRRYLRAANVGWSGLLLDDVKEMNFTDAEMSVYSLKPGDLLLGEASGSPGEVGKPALWNGELAECAFQNTLLRVRSEVMEPRFLLHFFRFMALSGRFVEQSRGVGIHHLGRERFARWPTPRPSVEEQKRIVEILEEHLTSLGHAAISLKQARARTQTLLAKSLSAVRMGEEFALSDLAVIQSGIQKQAKRAPRHNAFPFLRVANVTAGGLDLGDVHHVELFQGELERYALATGDLLVVEGNGSPSQIGRAAVWDGSIANCTHQNHLIRVRPNHERVLPKYLEAVWNSPENRSVLTDVASSSSGLYTLSVRKLAQLRVPVPSLDEQRAAVDRLERAQEADRRLRQSLDIALLRGAGLRKAVLAAAFEGHLTGASSDTEVIEEFAEQEPV